MALTNYQKQLLESAKKAAQELNEHGKALTGLIGELSACEQRNLEWRPGAVGYDAVSRDDHKVQIKTRKSWTTEGVNPRGRLGKFGRKAGYKFDLGLFVELDSNFSVAEIWEMSKDKIEELEAKEKGGRGLHVSTFQKHADMRLGPAG